MALESLKETFATVECAHCGRLTKKSYVIHDSVITYKCPACWGSFFAQKHFPKFTFYNTFTITLNWKRPTIDWMQSQCFPFPNDICQVIIDYYQASKEQMDWNCVCEASLKILYSKMWRAMSIDVQIEWTDEESPPRESFEVEESFPNKFSSWLQKVFPSHRSWFPMVPFYKLELPDISRKEKKIQKLLDKIVRKRARIAEMQESFTIDAGFQNWCKSMDKK